MANKAKLEGHDAFLQMLVEFSVPKNPYSQNLKSSHKAWNDGFWNAMYDWKMTLSTLDCIALAKAIAKAEGG